MSSETKREFSPEAQAAFRQMLYHKLAMWDASSDLENLLGCEVDTGMLDSLASEFGPADDALGLPDPELLETMQDWMSDPDHATFYEEDE